LVPEENILGMMYGQAEELFALLRAVPEKEAGVRHAPYTWSVREVVGHMMDAERVFAYRALRFARGDATPLPGFEENEYVRAAEFDRYPLIELVAEFEAIRRTTFWLFRHLTEEAWGRTGVAN